LSTKKYNRRSRLLWGTLLLQRAMSVPGCFSVDKEETTIYKGKAFQQAIFKLYPVQSAVYRPSTLNHIQARWVPKNERRNEDVTSGV
jgi:hypothetical protein